jgi:outer membrane immunogenic protein
MTDKAAETTLSRHLRNTRLILSGTSQSGMEISKFQAKVVSAVRMVFWAEIFVRGPLMRTSNLAFAAAASVSAMVGISAASAADMAVKAPRPAPIVAVYDWTGGYAGVNGGWAWDNSAGHLDTYSTAPGVDFTPLVAAGVVPINLGAKNEGGFGGAQVGYNWQTDRWVFGLEADIQGADLGRAGLIFVPGGFTNAVTITWRDRIDWFGTVRGRIGLAANNVLFYGTGGLAYGGVNSSVSLVATPSAAGNFAGSISDTRFGWAAGAGVEWGITANWTAKAEYLHVDLGSSSVTITDPHYPSAFATYGFRHQLDTVRVGVNYKWGGPILAKY